MSGSQSGVRESGEKQMRNTVLPLIPFQNPIWRKYVLMRRYFISLWLIRWLKTPVLSTWQLLSFCAKIISHTITVFSCYLATANDPMANRWNKIDKKDYWLYEHGVFYKISALKTQFWRTENKERAYNEGRLFSAWSSSSSTIFMSF